MRRSRFLLLAILAGVLAQACSSPTMPPYPSPDDTGSPEPPPSQGFTVPQP
jgi:hypothetical protein